MIRGIGATKYMEEIDQGTTTGVYFEILVNGNPYQFKLPAKTDLIFEALKAEDIKRRKRSHRHTQKQLDELKKQAFRTSFRNLRDWIHIQVSMIEASQIEFREAFLPYFYDGEKTLYQKVVEQQFLLK